MKCPECKGEGGGIDCTEEWSDCPCCHGEGECTEERHAEWRKQIADMDAEIDRLMNA